MNFFLLALFAHLLADFVFQSNRLAAKKNSFYCGNRKWFKDLINLKNPLLYHGLIVLFINLLVLLYTNDTIKAMVLICWLSLVHIIIDHIKTHYGTYKRNSPYKGLVIFLIAQLIQVVVIIFSVSLSNLTYDSLRAIYLPRFLSNVMPQMSGNHLYIYQLTDKQLTIGILFVVFSFGVASIIPFILDNYLGKKEPTKGSIINHQMQMIESTQRTNNIGRLIGILERMIIILLVSLNQYGALGIILAGKSVARFNELSDKEFAEYYLLGTFLSFIFGLIGGILIRGVV